MKASNHLPSLALLSLQTPQAASKTGAGMKRDADGILIMSAEQIMPGYVQKMADLIRSGFLRFSMRALNEQVNECSFKIVIPAFRGAYDGYVSTYDRPPTYDQIKPFLEVLKLPPFRCFYDPLTQSWKTRKPRGVAWEAAFVAAAQHYESHHSRAARERTEAENRAWAQEQDRLRRLREQEGREAREREVEQARLRREEAARQAEAAAAQRRADEARGNALVLRGIDQGAMLPAEDPEWSQDDLDWYWTTFGVDLRQARDRALSQLVMTTYTKTLNEKLSRMHSPTEKRRYSLKHWQMARVGETVIGTLDALSERIVQAYKRADPPLDPVQDATRVQFVASTDLEIIAGITVTLRVSTTPSAAEKAIAANKTDEYAAITWTMLFAHGSNARAVASRALVEAGYKVPKLGAQVQIRNGNTLNIALDALYEAMDVTEQGQIVTRNGVRAPPPLDRLGAARRLPPPRPRAQNNNDAEDGEAEHDEEQPPNMAMIAMDLSDDGV